MAINVNIPSQFREYANLAAFPTTGSAKILYVAKNTNKLYRWETSAYVEVSASAASSWGSITGTLSNQTDLQSAINGKQDTLVSGTNVKTVEGQSILGSGDISITKSDVGLGNVDNTSDADKPISDATQTALNAKQNNLISGVNIKTVNSQSILGIGAVTVQDTLVSGTNIKTINGSSVLGSGDLVVSATANPSVIVLNTTDGTAVTGTLVETISRSLLIPANTFTSSGMLEVVARVFKTGTLGAQSFRVYKNTTNSLTGATLIGSFLGANSAVFAQGIRTYRINSNTLTGFSTALSVLTDYASSTNAEVSTTFTTSVDNYILFAIQLVSSTDSSVVKMARATKYI